MWAFPGSGGIADQKPYISSGPTLPFIKARLEGVRIKGRVGREDEGDGGRTG